MTQLNVFQIGLISTALWTTAVVLMIVQSFVGGEVYIGQWALLCGLGAAVSTAAAIMRCVVKRERLRVEAMLDMHAARRDSVTPLR